MRSRNFVLLLKFLIIVPAFSCFAQSSNKYLIYNARIIDVIKGSIRKENAVLIEGSIISAFGDYKALNAGVPASHQIDAKNKFVIPGLWDNHIHLEGEKLVEDNKALIPLFLTYGITTVRDCADDLGEQVLKWRDEIKQGSLPGPTLFTAGLKLEGKNSIWKGDLEIENEQELNAMLDKLDGWKVDFVKITENTLQGPLFLKSIEAAHARGYLVSGHVPIELTIEEMVDKGLSSVEHASYLMRLGYDEKTIVENLKAGKISKVDAAKLYQGTFNQQLADENYKKLGKMGLSVTPTLIGSRQLAFLDEDNHQKDSMMVSYLTKAYTDSYQWRIDRMKAEKPEQKEERKNRYRLVVSQVPHMQAAGINILAGSDEAALNTFVYPGESLIDELHIFQQAGMKPADILRTATINGARFLKKEKQMGSLEVGKVADIVIVDQNPLLDINALQHINCVFTRGRYLDRKALNQILADVKQAKIRLDKERDSQH